MHIPTKGPMHKLGWSGERRKGKETLDIDEDPEGLLQAHMNVTTGALLAMGIRFAGTGNALAQKLLIEHIHLYMKAKIQAPDPCSGELYALCLISRLHNVSIYPTISPQPQ